jgi:hypothetical protein
MIDYRTPGAAPEPEPAPRFHITYVTIKKDKYSGENEFQLNCMSFDTKAEVETFITRNPAVVKGCIVFYGHKSIPKLEVETIHTVRW